MPETEKLFGPGCPWYGMYESWGPGNIKWCEERLCAWINEPANAWSNIPYILVGLWIIWYSRKRNMRLGRLFGFSAVIVGVTSFVWHATNNFLTQVADFFGMYVFVYLLLVLNLWRLKVVKEKQVYPWYWGLVFASTFAIPVAKHFDVKYQMIVFIGAIGIVITEMLNRRVYKKQGPKVKFWPFTVGILFFVVALGCWMIDFKRIVCDPQNHFIQGHALWHVFGAAGIHFAFLYYRQFIEKKSA